MCEFGVNDLKYTDMKPELCYTLNDRCKGDAAESETRHKTGRGTFPVGAVR